MTRHLLSLADLSPDELARVLELAREGGPCEVLAGRGVALVFEHPSARTRNAFEMAAFQLGGHPVTIRADEVGIDKRESAEDVARTLACYHCVLAARVERHSTLERMAAALDEAGATVPVLNLLSDREHPTQAVADLLTIAHHRGELAGTAIAYIGDANNVCRSLLAAAGLADLSLRVASPTGYGLSEEDLAWGQSLGADVKVFERPEEAVAGAHAVYTDVWISMGEEEREVVKRQAFGGFAVDEALLGHAEPDVLVMHCLPAHRGEEISAGVLASANSVVWEQAANRLQAARGILSFLAEETGVPR